MKKANAISSIKKWEKIVADIHGAKPENYPKGYYSWSSWFNKVARGECGYCKEYMICYSCSTCPLVKQYCDSRYYHNEHKTFWKMYDACPKGDRKNILRHAQTMLKAVKKFSGLKVSK